MSRSKIKNVKSKAVLRFRYYIAPALFLLAITITLITYKSVQQYADCGCGDPNDQYGVYLPAEKTAYYLDEPIDMSLAEVSDKPNYILGDQSGDEKWIEIDLSDQTLRAWQGSSLFLETLVSTGKWNRTPVGEFRIWSKFKYTKMSGGSKANNTYYYLPNVPFTMYFNGGYGIHGTYWHNNFGHAMSHGCVNMKTTDVAKLYEWADAPADGKKGTPITIFGEQLF